MTASASCPAGLLALERVDKTGQQRGELVAIARGPVGHGPIEYGASCAVHGIELGPAAGRECER